MVGELRTWEVSRSQVNPLFSSTNENNILPQLPHQAPKDYNGTNMINVKLNLASFPTFLAAGVDLWTEQNGKEEGVEGERNIYIAT